MKQRGKEEQQQEMMDLKLCKQHNNKIEYICLYIAKCKTDKSCNHRFLCNTCNSEFYHDQSHQKFTFQIDKFVNEDLSKEFYLLFFTQPQFRALHDPQTYMRINSDNILNKLKDMTIKLKMYNQQQVQNSLQQSANMSTGDESNMVFIENAHNKIEQISERINQLISYYNECFRMEFEYDPFKQIIIYFLTSQITLDQATDIINRALAFIHCAQLFMKNVYVVDENLNLSQSDLANTGKNTISDVFSFYKFARKELFLNLNHIRSLYYICQPDQIKALENKQRLSLITNFPVNVKRLMPTVSMAKTINIKLIENQLLIIREYECLVLQIFINTQESKLQNIIYSKKAIRDATICLCDNNQVILLFKDNSIGIYQIKPYISVLDNEQIYLYEISKTHQFIGVDVIKPQSTSDSYSEKLGIENEVDDLNDYITLKTKEEICLFESLEWNEINSFKHTQELFKLEFSSENEEMMTDDMDIDNKGQKVLCFYKGEQIDQSHFQNADLFKQNQIKAYSYNPTSKQFVYITENEMIVVSDQNKTKKQMKSRQVISYMGFTADNTYLFILYDNTLIQFFYVTDNSFELEYETNLSKISTIKNAVFFQNTNQLFVLSSKGELFYIDLSSPKNYF